MGMTIAQKVIAEHLLSGDLTPGSEVALRIDQTLTQDATGTMAYLAFEGMGIPQVRTDLSVAYVDHNTLQCGLTISICRRWQPSMVCGSPDRVTVSAIRCIWNGLVSRAKR